MEGDGDDKTEVPQSEIEWFCWSDEYIGGTTSQYVAAGKCYQIVGRAPNEYLIDYLRNYNSK